MSKRITESSSSSDGERDNTDVGAKEKKSGHPTGGNGKGSRKKARIGSAVSEEREASPVASTSAQLRRELGIIVKDEFEESEDEVEQELTVSPPERLAPTCSGSASNPKVRRSTRERAPSKLLTLHWISKCGDYEQRHPRPKKVPVLEPREKYFEGCLVMGWIAHGLPYWPGMIRKPGSDDDEHFDYTRRNDRGKTEFCVQFFTDPTTLHWRIPLTLRVFDASKQNWCKYREPTIVAEYEKGIRIAKAASNFPVEARLTKFTLPQEAGIDDLLREIDGWYCQHEPAQRISNTDEVTGLKKQAEFLKKKDLEKEETIKALKTDNSKLAEELEKVKATNRNLTLRLQSKDPEKSRMESLERQLKAKDKLIAELRQYKLEKLRSEVESLEGLLDVDVTEDGSGT